MATRNLEIARNAGADGRSAAGDCGVRRGRGNGRARDGSSGGSGSDACGSGPNATADGGPGYGGSGNRSAKANRRARNGGSGNSRARYCGSDAGPSQDSPSYGGADGSAHSGSVCGTGAATTACFDGASGRSGDNEVAAGGLAERAGASLQLV